MRATARQQGFTLIELMVTITVIAILASLAGPSMGDLIERRRLASQTEAITDLLHLARSEAIRHTGEVVHDGVVQPRSITVTVNPTANSWFVGLANGEAGCTTDDLKESSACGLMDPGVPVDLVNNPNKKVLRYVKNSECAGCTISLPSTTEAFTFSFRGLVEAGGADRVIELKSPKGYQTRVSVSRIGRVSVCSPSGPLSSYPAC